MHGFWSAPSLTICHASIVDPAEGDDSRGGGPSRVGWFLEGRGLIRGAEAPPKSGGSLFPGWSRGRVWTVMFLHKSWCWAGSGPELGQLPRTRAYVAGTEQLREHPGFESNGHRDLEPLLPRRCWSCETLCSEKRFPPAPLVLCCLAVRTVHPDPGLTAGLYLFL